VFVSRYRGFLFFEEMGRYVDTTNITPNRILAMPSVRQVTANRPRRRPPGAASFLSEAHEGSGERKSPRWLRARAVCVSHCAIWMDDSRNGIARPLVCNLLSGNVGRYLPMMVSVRRSAVKLSHVKKPACWQRRGRVAIGFSSRRTPTMVIAARVAFNLHSGNVSGCLPA
jgi:hypothetical protein